MILKSSDFVGLGQVQMRSPNAHPNDSRAWEPGHANGLTKRELFAAMAMQAFITRMKLTGAFEAKACVAMADLLITELNK